MNKEIQLKCQDCLLNYLNFSTTSFDHILVVVLYIPFHNLIALIIYIPSMLLLINHGFTEDTSSMGRK